MTVRIGVGGIDRFAFSLRSVEISKVRGDGGGSGGYIIRSFYIIRKHYTTEVCGRSRGGAAIGTGWWGGSGSRVRVP